jgi:transglutaminase-like putative cysteine protease
MRIRISHETLYHYDQPVRYGAQELRLSPQNLESQKIIEWQIECPGIENAPSWVDAWNNLTYLTTQTDERDALHIKVSGIAETHDASGIVGRVQNPAEPRFYIRATPLTESSREIDAIVHELTGRHRDQLALYHALMEIIRERMQFETGKTMSLTTAGAALKAGHGVCQDFSHVFIAVCRQMGQPARYVTGYLLMEGEEDELVSDAHHAWVEAEVPGLGWVGFDPANGISPDERYVRLACGLDADSAAPVRGVWRGEGQQALTVIVNVEQVPEPH